MAFADDLAELQAAVYDPSDGFAVAAVWSRGGTPVAAPLMVLPDQTADTLIDDPHLGPRNREQRRWKVRASEAARLLPTGRPLKGDLVAIDGAPALRITGDPRQADDRRTEWTFELG